jgi:hypothetical protein
LPQARWQAQCLTYLRALPGIEIVDVPRADLLLDLSEDPRPDTWKPRLGRWRFVHGPEARLEGAGVREHLAGERTAMVRLVSIAADGTAGVLETGVLKCVPHSLAATRERIFEAVASWPARHLRRPVMAAGPMVRIESGRHISRLGVPLASARNLVRRRLSAMIDEHWVIGLIAKPVQHVIDGFDAREIRWLEAPAGQVLADPVGALMLDGRIQLLAEAYDFRDRQGRIVALEVEAGGASSAPREVLRLPVHASYPHLIEHDGAIYCLPEAHASNRVQLFRADPFPSRWRPDRVLLETFAGVDPTVLRHEGRWFLFAGNHADQDETKLYVFHADDLFGPWLAHAWNPVKCDIRGSRPAGPFFRRGGELFRPAQDCSRIYGGAIAVNRVIELTPEEFREETVAVLHPDTDGPRPHGLHSLAGIGDYTFIDGKRHTHPFGARFC